MLTSGMTSTFKLDWETPQWLFDKLDAEFHFTLDAAADDSNHKCERYYTKETDGLKSPWAGVVWCNPPYGKQIKKWVEKAWAEKCNCETIVLLIPARTDTLWFHNYILGKAEIRFIKGRLRFSGCAVNAPFPSMVVIYRQDPTEELPLLAWLEGKG